MAETMNKWMQDARTFAEESLDSEDFRMLDTHPNREKAYREVATSGMHTYQRMKKMLETPEHEADDPMIPFDLSREAMLDTLGTQMDKLFPGWLDKMQEAKRLDGDWLEQMRQAGLM